MYQFSLHSLEQLAKRNINEEVTLWVIQNTTEKIIEDEVTIYQSMILENNKSYLIRVFVNENKIPPLIITAYKTNKIQKY